MKGKCRLNCRKLFQGGHSVSKHTMHWLTGVPHASTASGLIRPDNGCSHLVQAHHLQAGFFCFQLQLIHHIYTHHLVKEKMLQTA